MRYSMIIWYKYTMWNDQIRVAKCPSPSTFKKNPLHFLLDYLGGGDTVARKNNSWANSISLFFWFTKFKNFSFHYFWFLSNSKQLCLKAYYPWDSGIKILSKSMLIQSYQFIACLPCYWILSNQLLCKILSSVALRIFRSHELCMIKKKKELESPLKDIES